MYNENMKKRVESILESYEKYPEMMNIDKYDSPNRDVLIGLIYKIRSLIFPGYFRKMNCEEQLRECLIWELEEIECRLHEQIVKAILFNKADFNVNRKKVFIKASEITSAFLDKIPNLRAKLHTDVYAAYYGDPAASGTDEIILSYPGLFSIIVHRIAHELFQLEVPLIPRILSEYAHGITGIDIHPAARIGESFFIDHGTGIVIGASTDIGKNVKIYQGVTLGALSLSKGRELRGNKRHPTICDNVTIYAGATILGGETIIGEGATIGGNAFIVNSIEKGAKIPFADDNKTLIPSE